MNAKNANWFIIFLFSCEIRDDFVRRRGRLRSTIIKWFKVLPSRGRLGHMVHSQHQKLFLLLGWFAGMAAAVIVGSHNYGLIALIGAGACIRVSGFDIDICLLPQFGGVGAGRGVPTLRVNRFTNTLRDILQWRHARGAMVGCFQNDESLPGAAYAW